MGSCQNKKIGIYDLWADIPYYILKINVIFNLASILTSITHISVIFSFIIPPKNSIIKKLIISILIISHATKMPPKPGAFSNL